MPSRLPLFERLVATALQRGYSIASVRDYWRVINEQAPEPERRYLILRHDVDTDPATARRMLEIERAAGVTSSSYYFRLSTLDVLLMREIEEGGGEASYHYEELATLMKRCRPRTREAAMELVPEAREAFRGNLDHVRARTNLAISTVAAHGDFANRALGVFNWEVLGDRDFRREVGVDLEAYDDEFMGHVTSHHWDTAPPRHWIPMDPAVALARGERVVYLLVHPRHWHVARLANARDDLGRLRDAVLFRLPFPARGDAPCDRAGPTG